MCLDCQNGPPFNKHFLTGGEIQMHTCEWACDEGYTQEDQYCAQLTNCSGPALTSDRFDFHPKCDPSKVLMEPGDECWVACAT